MQGILPILVSWDMDHKFSILTYTTGRPALHLYGAFPYLIKLNCQIGRFGLDFLVRIFGFFIGFQQNEIIISDFKLFLVYKIKTE